MIAVAAVWKLSYGVAAWSVAWCSYWNIAHLHIALMWNGPNFIISSPPLTEAHFSIHFNYDLLWLTNAIQSTDVFICLSPVHAQISRKFCSGFPCNFALSPPLPNLSYTSRPFMTFKNAIQWTGVLFNCLSPVGVQISHKSSRRIP